MAQEQKTYIAIFPYKSNNWNELKAQFITQTHWTEQSQVFIYRESVEACELKLGKLADVTPSDSSLEGRLFDNNYEVRWIKTQTGSFQAWATMEVSQDYKDAISVISKCRRYYLIGLFHTYNQNTNTATFTESRYTNKQFCYPIPANKIPQKEDRAYIKVMEYSPMVEWLDLKDTELNSIQNLLNQPMIIAHRFFAVDIGRD